MTTSFDIKQIINEEANHAAENDIDHAAENFSQRVMDMAATRDAKVDTDLVAQYSEQGDDSVIAEGIEVPYSMITDTRITVANIEDKHGYLSSKVEEYLQKYNIPAIPISEVGILEQVSSLQKHDLVTIDDVKYAVQRGADKERLTIYRDAIYEQLSSGIPYQKSLLIEVDAGDHKFKTLVLTIAEWTWLCNVYNDYNPKLYITPEHDFILSIGRC